MQNWLLPEFIEDVMPNEAARIELLRRQLLDLFKVHGYQYIIPPTLEYLESLMTGAGHHLDLATFKVVDQLTGRTMGLRADTTPQAARIDAHMLNYQGVSRLCYAGTVLRTQVEGISRTREPLQVGAELFGHQGIESDIEIQSLMIKALQLIGFNDLHIDLSHVGIFESLISSGDVNEDLERSLESALLSKDKALVASLAKDLDSDLQRALIALTELNGDADVLEKAIKVLPNFPGIAEALEELKALSSKLSGLALKVGFDLSELRGYRYHSGIVFAAYAPNYAGPVALGGRYDEVGEAFGRARPATGFSLDLRAVASALHPTESAKAILAPAGEADELLAEIEQLRSQGQIVIQALPNIQSDASELNCDRQLSQVNGQWQVKPLAN